MEFDFSNNGDQDWKTTSLLSDLSNNHDLNGSLKANLLDVLKELISRGDGDSNDQIAKDFINNFKKAICGISNDLLIALDNDEGEYKTSEKSSDTVDQNDVDVGEGKEVSSDGEVLDTEDEGNLTLDVDELTNEKTPSDTDTDESDDKKPKVDAFGMPLEVLDEKDIDVTDSDSKESSDTDKDSKETPTSDGESETEDSTKKDVDGPESESESEEKASKDSKKDSDLDDGESESESEKSESEDEKKDSDHRRHEKSESSKEEKEEHKGSKKDPDPTEEKPKKKSDGESEDEESDEKTDKPKKDHPSAKKTASSYFENVQYGGNKSVILERHSIVDLYL